MTYGNAMGTEKQLKGLLVSGQHDSPIPMFTFLNLEGGSVDPLAKYLGPRPSPSQFAAGRPCDSPRARVAKPPKTC